jgi:exopolysaccharide production protein ExoZ
LRSAGTSGESDRLQSIQALRAVAALMVVVYHATRLAVDRVDGLPDTVVWKSGEAGVDIFFVISGLVMGIAYHRTGSQDWRAFLKRRLIRIVPMYWIATSLKLLPLLAVPALALHSRFDLWHAVSSYLFIPARNPAGGIFPLLWVGWTLNFEMLFYALFTAALALRAPLLPFLATTIGLLALAGLWRTGDWPAPLRLLDPLLLEFLCGLWLASKLAKGLVIPRMACVMILLIASACILIAPESTDESVTRALVWGLPAFAIVAAVASLRWSPPQWLLELGNASYAIYLFHGFVMTATGALLKRIEFSHALLLLCSIGSVVFSAFLGVAVFKYVETPILRRLNSWFL